MMRDLTRETVTNNSASNQIDQLLDQANELYLDQEWAQALKVYTHILTLDATCVLAYVQRGLILNESGIPDKALLDFETAIELDPLCGMAYYGRGWVKHTYGDYQGELQDAIQALKCDRDNAGMYYRRIGSACHGLKDYTNAILAYNEAIRLNSNLDEGTLYNRGLCYTDMGEFQLALADFSRCLELDPDWTWAFTQRGWVYYKLGKYRQAVSDYNAALHIQPNYELAFLYRAFAYEKLDDRKNTISDLEALLELTHSHTRMQLAKKLLRKAKWFWWTRWL